MNAGITVKHSDLAMKPKSIVTNEDCMELMARYPDKHFDLAIVDPPYGIGYENGGQYFKHNYSKKNWDKEIPEEQYFIELQRVSKNQIIWGGNYFHMPPTRCFLIWYKTDEIKDRTFSECEYAWTSFTTPARHYELKPFQRNGSRIHPTQKPIALYKWILTNYAKEGDKILDTHGGSMSSVIACLELGFSITCCELDKDYFLKSKDRIDNYLSQGNLFQEKPEIKFVY